MANLEEQIVAILARKSYQPLKPKALARKVGVPTSQYREFQNALRSLVKNNRAEIGKNRTVRPARPHGHRPRLAVVARQRAPDPRARRASSTRRPRRNQT